MHEARLHSPKSGKRTAFRSCPCVVHPVSITRFPLTRFSPGSGLLRNPLFYTINDNISRVWVRKDGNLVTETGCIVCFGIAVQRTSSFLSEDHRILTRGPEGKYLGVHKGGFSKVGFSNTNILLTHKLLSPPLLKPPFVTSRDVRDTAAIEHAGGGQAARAL